MNKAKNEFLQWLRDRGAEDMEDDECGQDDEWDYYRSVTGFIADDFYMVIFMIWQGKVKIDYHSESGNKQFDNVDDFLKLIRC